MSLSEKLQSLKTEKEDAKYAAIKTWLSGLSEEDRILVLEYVQDPQMKTHTLLRIFRDEGARFGKDSFSAWRKKMLESSEETSK